jgi:hypothetical protein
MRIQDENSRQGKKHDLGTKLTCSTKLVPGGVLPPFLGFALLLPHCCSYNSSSNQSLVITTSFKSSALIPSYPITLTSWIHSNRKWNRDLRVKLGPKAGATLQTTQCMLFLCNCCIYSNLSYHPPNCFFHRMWLQHQPTLQFDRTVSSWLDY